MSPAILCEKNSIGIRSTFHIKVVLPTASIFALIRASNIASMKEIMICTAESAVSAQINGINQSGFCPVSNRSMKIREKAGLMIPMSEVITVVIIVNATATPAPRIFSLAKVIILLGLPPGSKESPGSNIRQMPVKELSKVSIGTLYVPFAGSFSTALFPLKPSSTTK